MSDESQDPLPIVCGFEPDEFRLAEEDRDDVKALTTALAALGFERVGIKWEQRTDSRVPRDMQPLRSIVFANPAAASFGNIFFNDQSVAMLYFFTPFLSGEFVLTSQYPRPYPNRSSSSVHVGTENLAPPEVLELHKASVASFLGRGLRPYAAWGKREQLASTELYYRHPDSGLKREYRHDAAVSFELIFDVLCGVTLVAWYFIPEPAPLARTFAATAATGMVASHWYTALYYAKRGTRWYRRFPLLVTPLGIAIVAWLMLRG